MFDVNPSGPANSCCPRSDSSLLARDGKRSAASHSDVAKRWRTSNYQSHTRVISICSPCIQHYSTSRRAALFR